MAGWEDGRMGGWKDGRVAGWADHDAGPALTGGDNEDDDEGGATDIVRSLTTQGAQILKLKQARERMERERDEQLDAKLLAKAKQDLEDEQSKQPCMAACMAAPSCACVGRVGARSLTRTCDVRQTGCSRRSRLRLTTTAR
jgi:hypothetical protein